MLTASIANFRGARKAELQCSPIALIAGRNGQGKTSALQAVTACATMKPIPVKVAKKDAEQLVYRGRERAKATLTDGDRQSICEWPDADAVSDGHTFECHDVAAGLDTMVDWKPDQLGSYLSEALEAVPNEDDLKAFLAELDCKLDPTAFEELWDSIELHGWDDGFKLQREKGTKLKGVWEHMTGQRYGTEKARKWQPEDFDEDLMDVEVRELEERVVKAEVSLKDLIGRKAITEADKIDLQKKVDALEGVEAELAATRTAIDDLDTEGRQLQEKLDATPGPPDDNDTSTCPHCGEEVEVQPKAFGGFELSVPGGVTDEKKQEMAAKREGIESQLRDVNDRRQNILAERLVLQKKITEANLAVETLDQSEVKTDQAEEAVSQANDAVAEAKHDLAQRKLRDTTRQTHEEIIQQIAVTTALKPGGLRLTKLIDALAEFQTEYVTEACIAADWGRVEINEDLSITYNGQPYALISNAEQFRVRATLQTVFAQKDGCDIVLVDCHDALDNQAKQGLIQLISWSELHAVICMAASKPQSVPDLGKHELGQTYWMENGQAIPIGKALEETGAAD